MTIVCWHCEWVYWSNNRESWMLIPQNYMRGEAIPLFRVHTEITLRASGVHGSWILLNNRKLFHLWRLGLMQWQKVSICREMIRIVIHFFLLSFGIWLDIMFLHSYNACKFHQQIQIYMGRDNAVNMVGSCNISDLD